MTAMISDITDGSIAHKSGLKKGDSLISINGYPIRDVIDYMYYSKDSLLNLKVKRGSKVNSYNIRTKETVDLGIELKPFRIKTCRNKCMFCFVNQLPKGMRKTLYVKDDDFRMSFLFGNYITLSNISKKDMQRIVDQKLSPLYVSVHTTNNATRRKMLGNPDAPDILNVIKTLVNHRIKIHAQIVICPGINDEELSSTIRDLQKFYPYVASIAVVPVGITKYAKSQIRPVDKDDAVKIINMVKNIRRRLKKRHGDPIVHLADELYLKANVSFPHFKEYGDFPQIENGVGLVSQFMNAAKHLKLPKKIDPKRVAVFSGVSFFPYLKDFIEKMKTVIGLDIDIFKIDNKYFGQTVTVTGLLTGKDIARAIIGKTRAECLLVPNVALRSGADVFIDNVTLKDLEDILGIPVKPIESTPKGMLQGITDGCEWQD